MYNSQHNHHHHHHHHCASVSPRISFSNDFVDAQQASKQEKTTRSDAAAPVLSTDFEFSVTNYSMMTADELFSKGRLLPFKDNKRPTTTLREELLAGDDDDDDEENYHQQGFSLRPPKSGSSSTRWKGFLGLRKSHIGSKKVEKTQGSSVSGLVNDGGATLNITSQEMTIEGGTSCRDVEIGI